MSAKRVWTRITRVENVPLREGRAVTAGATELAIFNVDGRYLTIENRCPHKGGPLCDGIVSGLAVVCPLHGRRFDLETGIAIRASEPCVATFPTRVEDGIIVVDVSGINRVQEDAA